MTHTTLLVAQIAGPAFIAIALGFVASRKQYENVYQNLQNETLAVFMTAMAVFAAGVVVVTTGNTWNTIPDAVVSLLGWAMIIKGLVLLIVPAHAERVAASIARGVLFPVLGVVLLALGVYLSVVGF